MLTQTMAVWPKEYLYLGTNQLHCSLAPGSLEQWGKNERIDHFRVPKTLIFKMRLGAQSFL